MPHDSNQGPAFGAALGVVLGVITRFAIIDTWPQPVPAFVSTLLVGVVGGVVLGYLRLSRYPVRASWALETSQGAAGASTSTSVISMLAVSSSPGLCAAYIVCCPVAITVGAGCGALLRDFQRGARERTAHN